MGGEVVTTNKGAAPTAPPLLLDVHAMSAVTEKLCHLASCRINATGFLQEVISGLVPYANHGVLKSILANLLAKSETFWLFWEVSENWRKNSGADDVEWFKAVTAAVSEMKEVVFSPLLEIGHSAKSVIGVLTKHYGKDAELFHLTETQKAIHFMCRLVSDYPRAELLGSWLELEKGSLEVERIIELSVFFG